MTKHKRKNQLQYYFLITGEIVFQTSDNEPGSIHLNGIVQNDMPNFPVRMIAKAQQTLQLHFFKKINDPSVQVIDVIITNVSQLGGMTDDYFHAAPAGSKLQELAPSDNDPFTTSAPAFAD